MINTNNSHLGEAMKYLMMAPVIMRYSALLNFREMDRDDITIRLNVVDDCHPTLEFNPKFLEKMIHPSLTAYLLYGEIYRMALQHTTIRKISDMVSCKLASDVIVYDEICIIKMQNDILEIVKQFPSVRKPEIAQILNKYKYKKDEHFFLEMLCEMFRNERNEQGDGNSKGDGNGKDDCKKGEGKPSDGNGKDDCKKGEGKGNGNGKPSSGELGECADAIEKHFSPNSVDYSTEKWGENASVEESIRQLTKHIASDTSCFGTLSGAMQQALLAANIQKFNPAKYINKFKQNVISKNRIDTRSKVNRRHGWEYPGQKVTYTCNILIAEDVSGSMSDENVAMGMALINKFIKHCNLSYCFWDGECGPITQARKPSKEYELIGRGFTNPQCVLDKIKAEKLHFDGIIFFTDNGFTFERPSKGSQKIMIIETEDACEAPSWVKHKMNMKDIVKYHKTRTALGSW